MALAHCPTCDLFLRPDQGCLHMPAMPLKRRFDASERQHHADALAVILPLHAEPCAANRKDNHA